MRLLLYINENSNVILNAFSTFLKTILINFEHEIVVLCETENNKTFIEKHLLNDRYLVKVINVYEMKKNKGMGLMSDHFKPNKNKKLGFANYYHGIENLRICNEEIVSDLYLAIQSVLVEHEIKVVCYCNCMLSVFRSIGILIMHDIVQNLNIPFYWITKTPIKGRFAIYESLYYDHKKIDDDYQSFIKNPVQSFASGLDTFFNRYLDFKQNEHAVSFEGIRIQNIKNKTFRDTLINFRAQMTLTYLRYFKGQRKYFNFEQRDTGRPYILYLLTKANHWYTSYANPDLLEQSNTVTNVWRSIPSGFDLVLKKHPRITFDFDIEKLASRLPHCYMGDHFSTIELVENASIVIYTGTTSGVEALVQNKHVIEIGNRSLGLNIENPPLKRVQNFAELQEVFIECLEEEPPSKRIYAFFHSLLKNSYPFNDDSDNTSLDRNTETFRKMAEVLVQKLKSDVVEDNNDQKFFG